MKSDSAFRSQLPGHSTCVRAGERRMRNAVSFPFDRTIEPEMAKKVKNYIEPD